MAAVKKDDVVSMFDSFKEFKETKNIDRTTLVSVLRRASATFSQRSSEAMRTSTLS